MDENDQGLGSKKDDGTAGASRARGSEGARALARAIGRGAAAGIAATAVMSATMLLSQRLGLLGRMPPRKISDHVLGAVGLRHKTPEPMKKAFATVNHFAFGAVCGALFSAGKHVVRRALRGRTGSGAAGDARLARAATVGAGLAFGTLVWTVSYVGWVPAFGIMPIPSRDRPGRPTSMVLAHWVYGAVLGTTA